MALVLHGAAQVTPQATLDPQQQVVFNSLTAIRAASTEHEDAFLKLSLIKAKQEAELRQVESAYSAYEAELQANTERCNEMALEEASANQSTKELMAATASAARDFNNLFHSTQALSGNLKERGERLKEEQQDAWRRLRKEELYVAATKEAALQASQLPAKDAEDLLLLLTESSLEAKELQEVQQETERFLAACNMAGNVPLQLQRAVKKLFDSSSTLEALASRLAALEN